MNVNTDNYSRFIDRAFNSGNASKQIIVDRTGDKPVRHHIDGEQCRIVENNDKEVTVQFADGKRMTAQWFRIESTG